MIDSVKIDVYSRDHLPPHFHALYAEYEELIEIVSLKTYIGKIPAAQRKKVIAWAMGNKDYLMGIFKQLNPRL